ncbi:MAG: cytidylate kinase-like family protein [Lachnospiraceae bacterium]|nr:cytidylate kinase-like family protein [Lachnospiraceae bacterium]
MEKDREKCLKLAIRIYELDAMVYKASGSDLGRTFSGSKKHNIDELLILIMSNPQGHLLRSEMALIGNMARSIRDKQVRHDLMVEYNDILEEIASLPKSFGSVDIVDKDLADLNSSILNKKFSDEDHLVICISRSHGSAGTDIGFALSESLRINYYDEAVLNQILERRDVKEFGADGPKTNDFSRYHGLSKQDAMFFRQSALICELAKQEDMIVMGRCADVVLTGQHIPHISIYITAPFAIRVRRMMEVKNMDLKQAINMIRKMDHKHQDYYHAYTGRRWGDAINYDLCINSACYGIEESVELIERLINRQAKPNRHKEQSPKK